MLLGYVIFSYGNKLSMYRNIKLNECDRYSDTYTINRIDPNFKIKTNKHITSTYDNFTIVSEQFKTFCESEKYDGLEFMILPKSPGFYWFKIHNIIKFDAEAYGTRFINYNKQCDGYEEIIGATPACLKVKELIPDGFFRTDICFGSFANKFPLKIVGIKTQQKIKGAGFKGIDWDEVMDKYDWQK
jgi:hypothetical protein